MKNIVKKIVTIILMISCIGIMWFSNNVYGSFADFDDETADKQANEDLKEQEAEDAKNAGKSSNNYLAQLSVAGYKITPAFDKQVINYSIEDEIIESSIEINAIADDSRATVTGAGKVELQSGENNLRIDVTAENGVARTYFIKVAKKIDEESLKLKNLKLVGITNGGISENLEISPEFDKDIFKYECKIYNGVTKIDLEALPEVEGSIVEINGNENLQVGSNIITITIKSEDGSDETIYKVDVYRAESVEVATNTDEVKTDISVIVIAILVISVILIIMFVFTKKHKNKGRKH